MKDIISAMVNNTDLIPWYWLSYGEKCYAFATVEAYPEHETDPFPEPGTELEMDEGGNWVGNNGINMIIESEIASIERQNGQVICEFIARTHDYFLRDYITESNEEPPSKHRRIAIP